MSGTSLDGLDCVLTKITGTGLQMEAGFVRLQSAAFPKAVASALSALANGKSVTAQVTATAARALAVLHAETIGLLLDAEPQIRVDFVCAHGQTIYHNGEANLSFQLFDPWPIVRETNLPVCYDLRQADLVAGGHGAPLSPIADPILYHQHPDAAIINLGGICNITTTAPAPGSGAGVGVESPAAPLSRMDIEAEEKGKKGSDPCNSFDSQDDIAPKPAPLPGALPGAVGGFDAGPCNLLLDGLCQRLFHQAYDLDGSIAASEPPDPGLVQTIRERIGFTPDTRSMGREQFGGGWINSLLVKCADVTPQAWISAANQAVAQEIGEHIQRIDASVAILAGGGVSNQTLVARIKQASGGTRILTSDETGVPARAREAMAWAVLGALSQDGIPISLPHVTGSTNPGVAGSWAGI